MLRGCSLQNNEQIERNGFKRPLTKMEIIPFPSEHFHSYSLRQAGNQALDAKEFSSSFDGWGTASK